MQSPISLKSTERQVFQSTFADGLWDIFIAGFALQFAIAPLLSERLGDFWSSAIFLPFWALLYLAIWLTRKYVVAPRLGTVRFHKARQQKLRKFGLVMVAVNLLAFVLGLLAALNFGVRPDTNTLSLFPTLFSLSLLAGFSAAAYFLECPRLYFYGLLLFAAVPTGEWLFANRLAAHHGFPIAFGFCAAVMILTGLTLFIRLLKNNPVPVSGEG